MTSTDSNQNSNNILEETIIYCWPYTAAADSKTVTKYEVQTAEKVPWYKYDSRPQKKKKQKSEIDPVSVLASAFLVVWVLALLPGLHFSLGANSWGLFKGLPLLILPLYAMRRGLTHLRINEVGIALESSSGKSLMKSTQLHWRDITRLHVEPAPPGKPPLSGNFVISTRGMGNKKISLKKIATASEWRKLVAAADGYIRSNVFCSATNELDPALLDAFAAVTLDDPSYTKLWLDALSAPPRRERLVPLVAGSELQSGKFKILSKLGSGGQGSAYLATTSNNQKVVLKEYILPVYVDKPVRKQAIEAFQNEAKTLSSLNDDHIVKMLDSFIEDQRAYLVLEYVHGVSLREAVKKGGPIEEGECLRLAEHMCAALEQLHGHTPAVVHQDFTPDNLILDESGVLKLIDFMVAKQVESDSSNDSTGTVVGKHHYMPPEQFRGKATPQSDLYALGCTLYFVLTGEDPEPMSPAHPILLNSNISAALDHIVEKATQLDCSSRYQHISEIKFDIQQLSAVALQQETNYQR